MRVLVQDGLNHKWEVYHSRFFVKIFITNGFIGLQIERQSTWNIFRLDSVWERAVFDSFCVHENIINLTRQHKQDEHLGNEQNNTFYQSKLLESVGQFATEKSV